MIKLLGLVFSGSDAFSLGTQSAILALDVEDRGGGVGCHNWLDVVVVVEEVTDLGGCVEAVKVVDEEDEEEVCEEDEEGAGNADAILQNGHASGG
jgi:hypothetical protein